MYQIEYQKELNDTWQMVCKNRFKAKLIPHYDFAKRQTREHGGRVRLVEVTLHGKQVIEKQQEVSN